MSILENKEETVKLFIKSLMTGQIKISKSVVLSAAYHYEQHLLDLDKKIREFQKKPSSDNIDFIFDSIARLRVYGFLDGELVDYEKKLRDLRSEISNLKNQIKELELKNKKLKDENIQLAEELKDRQNIINTYEGGFLNGDSNDDKM
jgi:predicted  nucleic acid-binding Zn-ribbon protein